MATNEEQVKNQEVTSQEQNVKQQNQTSQGDNTIPNDYVIDYARMRLIGKNNALINDMSRIRGYDIVFPESYDVFVKENEDVFKDVEENKRREAYNQVVTDYDNFKKGNYSHYASPFSVDFPKYVAPGFQADNLGRQTTYAPDVGTVQPFPGGKQVIYKTPDQIASSSGYAKDVDGQMKPLSELENAPGYLVRDEGRLEMGETPYIWRKAKEGELVSADVAKSIWGDKLVESNGWNSFGRGLWSGSVPLMMKGIAGVADFFNSLTSDNDTPSQFVTDLYNASNYLVKQNLDEQGRWFEDWNSFIYNLGNGMSQLGTMVLTTYATGGIASYLNLVNAPKIAQQVGLAFGSFEAGGMMNEVGIEMGLDGNSRALMWLGFSTITYGSERIIPANVMQSFYGRGARTLARDVKKELAGEAWDQMSDKAKISTGRKIFTKILNKRKMLGKLADKTGFAGRATLAALEESFEEGVEGVGHMTAESLFNMTRGVELQKQALQKGNAISVLERYGNSSYEQIPDTSNLIPTGRFDDSGKFVSDSGKDWKRTNPDGSIDLISQSEYEQNMADMKHAKKVMEGKVVYDAEFSWDEPVMAFFSTFATMGLMGGFNSIKGKRKNEVKSAAQRQAFKELQDPSGKEEHKRRAAYEYLKKQGEMGFDHIDENGNLVKPNSGKSQADLNVAAMNAQIDYYKAIGRDLGIQDIKATNHVEDDENIVARVMNLRSEINELNTRKQQIEGGEKVTAGDDVTSSRNIEEIDGLIANRANEYDYLFNKTGTGYSQVINDNVKMTRINQFINQYNANRSKNTDPIPNVDIAKARDIEAFGDQIADIKLKIKQDVEENRRQQADILNKINDIENIDNISENNVSNVLEDINSLIDQLAQDDINIGAYEEASVRIEGAFERIAEPIRSVTQGISEIDLEVTEESEREAVKDLSYSQRIEKYLKEREGLAEFDEEERSVHEKLASVLEQERKLEAVSGRFRSKEKKPLRVSEEQLEQMAIEELVGDQRSDWVNMNQNIKNLSKEDMVRIKEDIEILSDIYLKFHVNQLLQNLNKETHRPYFNARKTVTDQDGNLQYGNILNGTFIERYNDVFKEMMADYSGEKELAALRENAWFQPVFEEVDRIQEELRKEAQEVIDNEKLSEQEKATRLNDIERRSDQDVLFNDALNNLKAQAATPSRERAAIDQMLLEMRNALEKKKAQENKLRLYMQQLHEKRLQKEKQIEEAGKMWSDGTHKEVKESIKIAAEEVHNSLELDISKSDFIAMERLFRGKTSIEYEEKNTTLLDRLEANGYVMFDSDAQYDYFLTPKGTHALNKLYARLETRKAVKRGEDMFPEYSNIPELKDYSEIYGQLYNEHKFGLDLYLKLDDKADEIANEISELEEKLAMAEGSASNVPTTIDQLDSFEMLSDMFAEEYKKVQTTYMLSFPTLLNIVDNNIVTVSQRENMRLRGKIKLDVALLFDVATFAQSHLKGDITSRLNDLKEKVDNIHSIDKVPQEALNGIITELHNIKKVLAKELANNTKAIDDALTELRLYMNVVKKTYEDTAGNNMTIEISSYDDGADTVGITEDEIYAWKYIQGENDVIDINFFNLQLSAEKFAKKDVGSDSSSIFTSYMVKFTNLMNELVNENYQDSFDQMKHIIDQYNIDKDKMPSVQQQEAINFAYNRITSPHGFWAIVEHANKRKLADGTNSFFYPATLALNGVLIQGNGGAGKTSVVLDVLMGMINNHLKNKKVEGTKVLAVAQSDRKSDELKNRLNNLDSLTSEQSYEAKQFINAIKNGDVKNQYDLIIIDEVSRLNNEDTKVLLDYQKNNPAVKFIMLGDVTQSVNELDVKNVKYEYAIPVFPHIARTSNITENFRTGNYDIYMLQLAIDRSISGVANTDIPFPKDVKYNKEHTGGVLYATNKVDAIAKWENDQAKDDRDQRNLIFRTASEANQYCKGKNIASTNNIYYIVEDEKPAVDGLTTAQGLEFPYVYVAMEMPNPSDSILYYKDYKTATSRGQEFVCCVSKEKSIQSERLFNTNNLPEKEAAEYKEIMNEVWRNNQGTIQTLGESVKKKSPPKETTKKSKSSRVNIEKSQKTNTKENTPSQQEENSTKDVKPYLGYKVNENAKLPDEEGIENKEVYYEERYEEETVIFKGYYEAKKYVGKDYVPEADVIVAALEYTDKDGNVEMKYISRELFIDSFNFKKVSVPVSDDINFSNTNPFDDDPTDQYDDKKSEEASTESDPIKSRINKITASARVFSDKQQIPLSLVATQEGDHNDPDNYFNQEFIKRKTLIAISALDENLDLTIEKGVSLYGYDNDINKQTPREFDALVVRHNDKVLGVIHKPIMNDDHMQEYAKTGKNNIEISKINPDNVYFESSEMTAYQKYIAMLWQKAYEMESGDTVATVVIENIKNGAAKLNPNKEELPLQNFITNAISKGYMFQLRDGSYSNNIDDIQKILVEQIKIDDYIYNHIYLQHESLIGSNKTNPQIIRVNNPLISENKEYRDILRKNLNTLGDIALRYSKVKKGKKASNILEEFARVLNESELMRAILMNKWLFVDTNRVIKKPKLVVWDGKYLKPKEGDANSSDRLKIAVGNLDAMLEDILVNGYIGSKIDKKEKDGTVVILQNTEHISNMTTTFGDINMPTAKISISNINNHDDNAESTTEDNTNLNPRQMMRKSIDVNPNNRVIRQQSRAYLESVLGKKTTKNALEFLNDATVDGVVTFGYVSKLKIILEDNGYGVLKGVAQHEAVHFVMRHLVTPQYRQRILNDVKDYLIRNDIKRNPNNEDAEEFLAEANRLGLRFTRVHPQSKGLKEYIYRFINWLNRLFKKVSTIGSQADYFLYALNKGHYVDKPIRYNNYDHTAKMKNEEGSEIANELIHAGYKIKEEGSMSRPELSKLFGGASQLARVEKWLTGTIYDNSFLNRNYRTANISIVESSRKTKQYLNTHYSHIRDYDNWNTFRLPLTKDHDEEWIRYAFTKLSDDVVFGSVMLQVMPQFNFSSEVIEKVWNELYDSENTMPAEEHSLSALSEMIINIIPYNTYRYQDGTITLTSENNKNVINKQKLNEVLTQAAIDSRHVQWHQKGMNALERWFDNIMTIAAQDGNVKDSEMTNISLSFVHFFSDKLGRKYNVVNLEGKTITRLGKEGKATEKQTVYSYMKYAMNPKEIMRAATKQDNAQIARNIRFRKDPVINSIYDRSIAANELLNGLYAHYGSLQKMDYINTKMVYTGKGIRYVPQSLMSTSAAEVATQIKNHIAYKFKNFGEEVYERIGPDGNIIQIKGNDVYWKPKGSLKQKILHFGSLRKNGRKTWSWTVSEPSLIRMVMNTFALDVNYSTVEYMRDNDGAKQFGLKDAADMIGGMIDVIMSNYHSLGYEDIDPEYRRRVEAYFHSRSRKLESHMEDRKGEDETGPIYSLTSFDNEIKALGKIRSKVNANALHDFNKQPEGGRVYTRVLTNSLSELLYNSETSATADRALKNTFKQLFDSMTMKEKSECPFLKLNKETGKYEIIDPLLRSAITDDLELSVKTIKYLSGIYSDYKGVNMSNATSRDFINNVLYGHYYETVYKETNSQFIAVPVNNFADSKMFPVLRVAFGKGGSRKLLNYRHTDDGIEASVDHETLNNTLDAYFEMKRVRMDQSLRRWRYLKINTTNGEVEKFVPDARDEKKWESEQGQDAYNEIIDYFDNELQKVKENKREFVHQLIKAGLTEGIDFIAERIVENGVEKVVDIYLGNDTVMDLNRPSNYQNAINYNSYWKWKNAKIEDRTKMRREIFKDRYMAFVKDATRGKYEYPDEVLAFGTYKDKPLAFKKLNNEYVWNPFYEVFFFTHYMVAESVQNITGGLDNQYKSSQDQSTRNKSITGQGILPITGGLLGLSENMNVLKLRDTWLFDEQLNEMFDVGNLEEYDSLIITSRIFGYAYNHSLGGEFALQRADENTYKTARTGVDLKKGRGEYVKSSMVTLNDDMYYNNRSMYLKLMEYMLTGNQKTVHPADPLLRQNLFEVFEIEMSKPGMTPSKAQKAVYDHIVRTRMTHGIDLMNNMVLKIEFKSSNKIHTPNINEKTLEEFLTDLLERKDDVVLATEESRKERFILNANQPVEEAFTTDPSQIKFISGIGDHNHERVKTIQTVDELRAIKAERAFDKLFVSKKGKLLSRREALHNLREKGKEITSNISGMTALMEMVYNQKVSMDVPTIKALLLPSMINIINKGFGRNTRGMKAVQNPGGYFFQYYDIETKHGTVVASEQDIRNRLYEKGDAKPRKLDFYQFGDNEIKKVVEVAMPFIYLKRFGIDENDRHSLNEILNIEVNGENLNVRAFLKKHCENYYESKEDGFKALRELLEGEDVEIGQNTYMKRKGLHTTPETLIEYYTALIDTLEIVAVRIPTSELSLGFVGEIVTITYDSGSTIYTSSLKNLFDNSDYDIDQLTVMFRHLRGSYDLETKVHSLSVDRAETMNENSKEDALMNNRFDALFDLYMDKRNLDAMLNALDISEDRAYVDKLREKRTNDKFQSDFLSNKENFIAAHMGTKLVGYFANAERVYGTLMSIANDVREDILPGFTFNGDGSNMKGDQIIKILSTMVQLAVDNKKEAMLYDLNINTVSSPIVVAMALNNFSKKEIYDFLQDKEIAWLIKDVFDSQSMGSKRKDIYQETITRINQLINAKDDEALLTKKEAQIRRRERLIEKYTNEYKDLDISKDQSYEEEHGTYDENGNVLYKEFSSGYSEAIMEDERGEPVTGKDFRKAIESAQLEYIDEIKRLENEIKAIKSIPDNEYIENEEEKINESLDKLNILKEHIHKGEFIKRLSSVFTLTENIPVNEAEIYSLINRIEFWADMDIKTYSSSTKEKASTPGAWKEYGRNMPEKKEVAWNKPSQEELNYYTQKVMDIALRKARQRLQDEGIKIDFKGVSRGQTGFDEAGIKALNTLGIPLKITLPKGRKYRDRWGVDRWDTDNIRFERMENIEQTEHDSGKYAKVTRSVIGESDMVINFVQQEDSPGILHTRKSSHSQNKPYVEITNVYDDIDAINEAANEIADNMYKTAKNNIEEAQRKIGGSLKETTLTINIAGNDMAILSNPPTSEKQAFEEFENAVRENGNILEIVDNIPNVRKALKLLGKIDTTMEKMFYSNMEFIKDLREDLIDLQELDPITYKDVYYSFYEELNNAVIDEYYRTKAIKYDFSKLASDIGLKRKDYIKDQFTGTRKSFDLNLADYHDSVHFVFEFIEFVSQLKEEFDDIREGDQRNNSNINKKVKNNLFIQNMVVDDNGIGIANEMSLTAEEVDAIRNDFKKLPRSLRKAFVDYNLLRNGFRYSRLSLNNYLGEVMAEEISSSIEAFAREIQSNEIMQDGLKERMEKNFVLNAIAKNDKLKIRDTRDRKRTPLILVKREGEWSHKHGKMMNVHDQMYVKRGDVYQPAYRLTNNYIKRLPIDDTIIVENEVVHPTDINVINKMADNASNIDMTFKFGHSYTKGSPVWGHTKLYIVNPIDYYSIRLKRENPDEYANRIAEWREKLEKAKESREGFGMHRLSAKATEAFVDFIKLHLPEKYGVEVVNNTTTHYPGRSGYVLNDVIYINSDLVTADTPMHEMGHILYPIIKAVSPSLYDEMVEDATNELRQNTKLAKKIKKLYPEYSRDDLIEEIAITKFGLVSHSKVKELLVTEKESVIQKILKWAKRIWDRIKRIFNNKFNANIKPDTKYVKLVDQILKNINNNVYNVGNNKSIKIKEGVSELFKSNFEFNTKEITTQQRQQAQQLYSQYLESLNKPNINPILQGNQEEQVKKFAELQERLNNKEFIKSAKSAYESSKGLQELGTQEQYNDYIARISLGIIKNPSSGGYNYTSKVKDIVYHGTEADNKFDKFDNPNISQGKNIFYFTENFNASLKYAKENKDKVIKVILNVNNLKFIDGQNGKLDWIDTVNTDLLKQYKQEGYDGVLAKDIWDSGIFSQYVVFKPEQIHILSSKQDIEGFKKFLQHEKNSNFLKYNRLEFEMIKLKESRSMNTQAQNVNDLEGALLLYGTGENLDDYLAKHDAQRIYNSLQKKENKIWQFAGKKYDFTKEFETENPKEVVINKIMEDVIPMQQQLKKEFPDKIVNFFDVNKGNGVYNQENLNNMAGLTRRQVSALKYSMTWNKDDRVIRYKDLKVLLESDPKFKDFYDKAFEGDNPVFIIHHLEKENGIVKRIDVSFFDFNNYPVNFQGLNNSNSLITGNLINDDAGKEKGIMLQNTIADLKKLKLGMLATKLMDGRESTVRIRKVGLVEAHSNKIEFHPVYLDRMITQLKALRDVEPFFNILPLPVQETLHKDELLNLETYHQDYFEMLLHNWQMTREKIGEAGKEIIDARSELLMRFMKDGEGETQLLEALRAQQKYIQKSRHLNDMDRMEQDDEMRFISNVIFEMTALNKKKESRTKQINYWQYLMTTQPAISHWVLENFASNARTSLRRISYEHGQFMKKFGAKTKEHVGSTGMSSYVKDVSKKIYDKYLMKEIIDDVEVDLKRVHWTTKDKRTRQAIRDGVIQMEDLKYGEYIADESVKFVKRLIRAYVLNNVDYYNKDGSLKEDRVNEAVDQIYDENWEKGMLPVISRDPVEAASQGDIMQMFQRFFAKTKEWEAIYDDSFNLTGNADMGNRTASMFMNQILGQVAPGYGNTQRMKYLGLELDQEGNVKVFDKKANEKTSKDIFEMMRYLAMDAMSKEVIEQEVLPYLDNAYTVARTLEMVEGKDQTLVKKWLKTWSDSVLHGKKQQVIPNKKHDDMISGGVNFLLRVTTFSGVAMSVPVGIVSLTANSVESVITSVANSISNPNEMFTFADFMKAGKEYTSNRKLVNAVTDEYQVYEADRFEKMQNIKFNPTKKHMWNSNFWQGPNRITDMEMRKIITVAQMIHDGTYQAHSIKDGELHYNPYKDKRFFGPGRTQTERQKILYEGLVDDLIKDGVFGQNEKEPAKRAYSIREERRLEFIANEFIVGTFDKEAQSAGYNYIPVRVIMQFRKFLHSKLQTRLAKKKTNVEGGYYAVVENDQGKLEREWINFEREGSWVTFGTYTLGMIPLLNDFLAKMQIISEKKSLKDWQNMSKLDKNNMARAMLDLTFAITTWILIEGLKGDDDDIDLKNEGIRDMIAAIQRGFLTVMATSPASISELATNIPMVDNIKRMFDLIMVKDVKQNIRGLTPFYSTGDLMYELSLRDDENN